MRARHSIILAGLLFLLLAGVAAASLPQVPVFLGQPLQGKDPLVKPSRITYTGDGTGFFAGGGYASHRPRIGRLRWQSWTATQAVAKGANWLDNCTPDCASGLRTPYSVALTLWRPRLVGGYLVFTRINVTYTKRVPLRWPKRFTMRLGHPVYGFVWSFPRIG